MRYFDTKFMEDANLFVSSLDPKTIKRILYNIDLAEQDNDSKMFKKLRNEIWEFRAKFGGLQIRLLAFRSKSENKDTLVVATHTYLKKVDKVPGNEIDRAERLRSKYFQSKLKR